MIPDPSKKFDIQTTIDAAQAFIRAQFLAGKPRPSGWHFVPDLKRNIYFPPRTPVSAETQAALIAAAEAKRARRAALRAGR